MWTDPLALIALDPEHSTSDVREWIIGTSYRQRLLVVVYSVRGEVTRIISARIATRNDREHYEEENY